MTTRDYCPNTGCWRWANHDGPHAMNGQTRRPLICICRYPQPTPTDMCARCFRVIPELVHQRRAQRALKAAT